MRLKLSALVLINLSALVNRHVQAARLPQDDNRLDIIKPPEADVTDDDDEIASSNSRLSIPAVGPSTPVPGVEFIDLDSFNGGSSDNNPSAAPQPSPASVFSSVDGQLTLIISSTISSSSSTPVSPPPGGAFFVTGSGEGLIRPVIRPTGAPRPATRPAARPPTDLTDTCGPVSQFYGSKAVNWTEAGVGPWLQGWWTIRQANFQTGGGFAGTFGADYLGNPNWRCQDDGSTDCEFDPCNQPVLNTVGLDVQPAYMVLQSTQNLHAYFQGLSQAFQVSAIFAALSKDEWARTYYTDVKDFSKTALKELVNAITSVVGVIAAFAAPFNAAIKIAASASATIFIAAANGIKYQLDSKTVNDTPIKAAKMGAELAQVFMQAILSFVGANDQLMSGENFLDTGDIRDYFADGAFLEFSGVDKTMVIQKSRDLLTSVAINYLWRQQKIWIMGGGPCDDSLEDKLGEGPEEATVCIDNRSWYLYYWREYGGIQLFRKKRWGHAEKPPGFDEFGKGDMENITIQVGRRGMNHDVLSSHANHLDPTVHHRLLRFRQQSRRTQLHTRDVHEAHTREYQGRTSGAQQRRSELGRHLHHSSL